MNMLLDRVPDCLTISGIRYPIKTSFRDWIKFENAIFNSEDSVSLTNIFRLVFKSLIPTPKHYDETVEQILWFYGCGKENNSSRGSSGRKEVFSYDYDDGYIQAAFRQQYGIDLNETDLHWWKFHAYMLSLSPDTEFVKIMGYRAVDINPKMSAAQRSFYQKMKKHYSLPVKKEEQERISRLEEALLNGEPIDELI